MQAAYRVYTASGPRAAPPPNMNVKPVLKAGRWPVTRRRLPAGARPAVFDRQYLSDYKVG